MKLLLHICCAPCAIYPHRVLREAGHGVQGFFYNPNIHPYREFARRAETLKEYAGAAGLEVLWESSYDLEEFLRRVAFKEEERCRLCYQMRLTRTARAAREGGFDAFTSTLLYSKYQKHELIQEAAREAARDAGIDFYYQDFREGWSEGVAASKALNLYRQPYCGCIYSERDRYSKVVGGGVGAAGP
jgi:predicted adenine nucleotide alpha hydrolase (AANH) superfamily ATPase